jgi:hypothetical protein
MRCYVQVDFRAGTLDTHLVASGGLVAVTVTVPGAEQCDTAIKVESSPALWALTQLVGKGG